MSRRQTSDDPLYLDLISSRDSWSVLAGDGPEDIKRKLAEAQKKYNELKSKSWIELGSEKHIHLKNLAIAKATVEYLLKKL